MVALTPAQAELVLDAISVAQNEVGAEDYRALELLAREIKAQMPGEGGA